MLLQLHSFFCADLRLRLFERPFDISDQCLLTGTVEPFPLPPLEAIHRTPKDPESERRDEQDQRRRERQNETEGLSGLIGGFCRRAYPDEFKKLRQRNGPPIAR